MLHREGAACLDRYLSSRSPPDHLLYHMLKVLIVVVDLTRHLRLSYLVRFGGYCELDVGEEFRLEASERVAFGLGKLR